MSLCLQGEKEVCTVLFVIHILLRQGAPVCVFVVQTEAGSCLIKFCHHFIKSKTKKKPLCYFFEACWLCRPVGVHSYAWVSQPSGIRGDSARVRALAPGWAERHVAPGAAVTSLSAEPVFIGNTHPNAPTHANSCLCNCVSLVISCMLQPAVLSLAILTQPLSLSVFPLHDASRWVVQYIWGVMTQCPKAERN